MESADLIQHVDALRAEIEARMGIRGRDLDQQVRRAGRLMPKTVKREAHYLSQARSLSENPKLARMIDMSKAEKALNVVRGFVETVDPTARMKSRILGIAAGLAFNFLLLAAVAIALLHWKGVV